MEAFAQTEVLQQSAQLPLYASGACVTAAVVTKTQIVVANCGDCRCVVGIAQHNGAANGAQSGTQTLVQELSHDHNMESATPQEIQRILSAGGTISPDNRITKPGAPGRLLTTRALGDYWAKPQGPQSNHIVS